MKVSQSVRMLSSRWASMYSSNSIFCSAVSDLLNASPDSTASVSACFYWLFCLKLLSPGLTFPVYRSSRMCISLPPIDSRRPGERVLPGRGAAIFCSCCVYHSFHLYTQQATESEESQEKKAELTFRLKPLVCSSGLYGRSAMRRTSNYGYFHRENRRIKTPISVSAARLNPLTDSGVSLDAGDLFTKFFVHLEHLPRC